ncbi:hypothetical protein BHE74_00014797, partial [Ensete ventricosum]
MWSYGTDRDYKVWTTPYRNECMPLFKEYNVGCPHLYLLKGSRDSAAAAAACKRGTESTSCLHAAANALHLSPTAVNNRDDTCDQRDHDCYYV